MYQRAYFYLRREKRHRLYQPTQSLCTLTYIKLQIVMSRAEFKLQITISRAEFILKTDFAVINFYFMNLLYTIEKGGGTPPVN